MSLLLTVTIVNVVWARRDRQRRRRAIPPQTCRSLHHHLLFWPPRWRAAERSPAVILDAHRGRVGRLALAWARAAQDEQTAGGKGVAKAKRGGRLLQIRCRAGDDRPCAQPGEGSERRRLEHRAFGQAVGDGWLACGRPRARDKAAGHQRLIFAVRISPRRRHRPLVRMYAQAVQVQSRGERRHGRGKRVRAVLDRRKAELEEFRLAHADRGHGTARGLQHAIARVRVGETAHFQMNGCEPRLPPSSREAEDAFDLCLELFGWDAVEACDQTGACFAGETAGELLEFLVVLQAGVVETHDDPGRASRDHRADRHTGRVLEDEDVRPGLTRRCQLAGRHRSSVRGHQQPGRQLRQHVGAAVLEADQRRCAERAQHPPGLRPDTAQGVGDIEPIGKPTRPIRPHDPHLAANAARCTLQEQIREGCRLVGMTGGEQRPAPAHVHPGVDTGAHAAKRDRRRRRHGRQASREVAEFVRHDVPPTLVQGSLPMAPFAGGARFPEFSSIIAGGCQPFSFILFQRRSFRAGLSRQRLQTSG